MPTENIKSQIRKGILDYCVLLLLNKQAAYTNDIIQLLQNAKLIVVDGTLYPLLSRLKNNGLLSYEWIESTQGPPRKYYRITEAGKIVLNELDTIWGEIQESIELIKKDQII